MNRLPSKALLSVLRQLETTKDGWSACCPACCTADIQRPSCLAIQEVREDELWVQCKNGCSVASITDAASRLIEEGSLFASNFTNTNKGINVMDGNPPIDSVPGPFQNQPQVENVCSPQELGDGSHSDRSWPPITRLLADMLPPFPTDVLPEVLRNWVRDVALSTQTPEDMAAMFALGTCAASIGGRVEVQAGPDWREPTNLFGLVALGPANLKSAVLRLATKPLVHLERELRAAATPDVASRKAIWDMKLKQLERAKKKAANTGLADDQEAVDDLARELAKIQEPVLPTLVVEDCTPEKLAEMLAAQQGRLASISAEGSVVFSLMKGKYSKSGEPQIDIYLKSHCGDPITVHRKGAGEVRCESPALTCIYAIQPDVLKGLTHGDSAFRGRGLLGRFLFAAPKSLIGSRDINPPPVRPGVSEAYSSLVRKLAGVAAGSVVRLDEGAKRCFDHWRAEVEAMLADGGQLELIRDWGGKLAGATARLAGVLHCVQADPEVPVPEDTMKAAVSISRYLIQHARYVLLGMSHGENDVSVQAFHVLSWIRRHEPEVFGQRDAHQSLKSRFSRAEDMAPALKELESRGYIRRGPKPQTSVGRPPAPVWEVNPAFLNDEPPARRDDPPVTLEPPRSLPSDDGTGRSQVSI